LPLLYKSWERRCHKAVVAVEEDNTEAEGGDDGTGEANELPGGW